MHLKKQRGEQKLRFRCPKHTKAGSHTAQPENETKGLFAVQKKLALMFLLLLLFSPIHFSACCGHNCPPMLFFSLAPTRAQSLWEPVHIFTFHTRLYIMVIAVIWH